MSRGKQPEFSASQRKYLLELHDAGTHTQEGWWPIACQWPLGGLVSQAPEAGPHY